MSVLEEMRAALSDDSFKISLATIEQVHISKDRSFLRAECRTVPDNYPIIAEIASDAVGGSSITIPNKNDLVLVAFSDEDQKAVVIKRLYSEEDKIPKQAVTGDTVLESLASKKLWLSSQNRINLSKNDQEPTENIVLGQVFKTFANSLLTTIATKYDNSSKHTHIGNLGIKTTPTDKAVQDTASKEEINALKASPIGDDAILSDLAYTEKGS